MEAAIRNIGHEVKWRTVPWVISIRTAEDGEVDLLPRHLMNEKREASLSVVAYGYKIRKIMFYSMESSNLNIDSIQELEKYKVGMLKDSFYSENFNFNSNIEKMQVRVTEQLNRLLKAGRIDVAVTSSAHDLDKFETVEGTKLVSYHDEFYNGRYLSIPKASPKHQYFEEFEKEIKRMAKEGKIDAIYAGKGLKPPKQKP